MYKRIKKYTSLLALLILTLTSFASAPILFEENRGQFFDERNHPIQSILFKTELGNIDLYITPHGITYIFKSIEEESVKERLKEISREQRGKFRRDHEVVKWKRVDVNFIGEKFKGISTDKILVKSPGAFYKNYYLPDTQGSVLNVKSYAELQITEIYPGIDWRIYFSNNQLKTEYVVHEGADYNDIQLKYTGAGNFFLDDKCSTVTIKSKYGTVKEGTLETFYERTPSQKLNLKYKLENNILSFVSNAKIDKEKSFVIDPPLQAEWGCFYGGNDADGSKAMSTDNQGNVYVSGYTLGSANFNLVDPGNNAHYQGQQGTGTNTSYLLKFDTNGNLIWATYYSGFEIRAWALTCDNNGHVFMAGGVASGLSVPTTNPAGSHTQAFGGCSDGFIVEFDNAGVRQWATYLGGTWFDFITGIVERNGDIYVTGRAESADFPFQSMGGKTYNNTIAGSGDVFLAQFNTQRAKVWTTAFGGSSYDEGSSLAFNSNGHLFVAGVTNSGNFPTVNATVFGAYNDGTFNGGNGFGNGGGNCGNPYTVNQSIGDVFIARFANASTMDWSTFVGGPNDDYSPEIAGDNNGNMFLFGVTQSNTGFPLTAPMAGGYYQSTYGGDGGFNKGDLFIARFTPNLLKDWCTYIGGNGQDASSNGSLGLYIKNNTVYATAFSQSSNFPTINTFGSGYYLPSGTTPAYWAPLIMQFTNSGVMEYSSFVGEYGWGSKIVVDNNSCIWLTGEWFNAQDPFPNNTNGYKQNFGGSDEIFITKFCPTCAQVTSVSTIADVTCNGDSTGIISISSSGGSAPFTYSWDHGATGDSISGLAAGDYIVNIMDGANCTTVDTFTVSEPAVLNVSLTNTSDFCNNDSSVIITALAGGGVGTIAYNWNNGSTVSSVSGLPAGTYNVLITDANLCTQAASITITQPPDLQTSSIKTDATCGNANGFVSLNVTGGQGAYSYSWSNGNTSSSISNLSAGNYSVVVSDAGGCADTLLIDIQNSGGPVFTLQTVSSPVCNGSGNGVAQINVTSGNEPCTYTWNTNPIQNSAQVSNLSAGTYTVIVTDANNCSTTQQIIVTEPPPITFTINYTNVLCNGAYDGTASPNVSSGYTWLWSNGETTNSVSNLSAGTYSLTAYDANNCSQTNSVIIAQPAGILFNVNTQASSCNTNDGTATVNNVSGGSSPYTYSWNNGNTNSSISGMAAGDYSVVVSDQNNCTVQMSVTIPSASGISATAIPTNTTCKETRDGAINIQMTGTSSPYTYSWNTGLVESVGNITGLPMGSYSVLITDINGCTISKNVNIINANPSPTINAGTDQYITEGESVSLTVSGGVAYSWMPDSALTCLQCATPTASPPHTMLYYVTGYDQNGCLNRDSVWVFVEERCRDLFVPTAFSPNNDLYNDFFYIRGSCISTFELSIYNRWGERVFYSEDISQTWDGTFRGKPLDAGVYVYYLTIITKSGQTVQQKGNVTLVR